MTALTLRWIAHVDEASEKTADKETDGETGATARIGLSTHYWWYCAGTLLNHITLGRQMHGYYRHARKLDNFPRVRAQSCAHVKHNDGPAQLRQHCWQQISSHSAASQWWLSVVDSMCNYGPVSWWCTLSFVVHRTSVGTFCHACTSQAYCFISGVIPCQFVGQFTNSGQADQTRWCLSLNVSWSLLHVHHSPASLYRFVVNHSKNTWEDRDNMSLGCNANTIKQIQSGYWNNCLLFLHVLHWNLCITHNVLDWVNVFVSESRLL